MTRFSEVVAMIDEQITAEFEKPLTAEIMEQINHVFTPYIFYKRDGKDQTAGYKGFCTYCRREFEVSYSMICLDGYTLKHRDHATCPFCRNEAILFHESRGKKVLTECRKVVVFRKADEDHVFAQGFYVWKIYNVCREKSLNSIFKPEEWEKDPPLELSESSRYYFTPEQVRHWRMEYDYIYHECICWNEIKNAVREPFGNGFGFQRYAGYFFINENVLADSFLRYSGMELYMSHEVSGWKAMKYLVYYSYHPVCEMMLKLGLGDFVIDAVELKKPHKRYIDWNGSKPTEIFKGSTMAEFKEMCKAKIDPSEYIWYKQLQRQGFGLTLLEVVTLGRKYLYKKKKVIELIKEFNISFTRLENYLKKYIDNELSGEGEMSAALTYWDDYLQAAERIGYDLTVERVRMPKNLTEAHDRAVAIDTAMKREVEEKEMKALTAKLEKLYGFEYEDMMIVVPHSMQEIIAEGKALSHCVGGYAERHARGETIILFLRQKSAPAVPWYTIELGKAYPGKQMMIRQCRGFKNTRKIPKPQKVKDFEAEFSEFIKNPKKYKKAHERKKSA